MNNQTARLMAAIAATFLLLIVFVSVRARSFHYCVDTGARTSRFVDAEAPCNRGEQPMEWQDLWRVQGGRSKLVMLGTTTAEAFGVHKP